MFCAVQIEQLQSQCCQLEKELARKQGDADVFKQEAENKLAERMRVALREQQLEYEGQVRPTPMMAHTNSPVICAPSPCPFLISMQYNIAWGMICASYIALWLVHCSA